MAAHAGSASADELTARASSRPRRFVTRDRRGSSEPLKVRGQKAQKAAETLGLRTVGDLLEHLPRDRREARTIAELVPGETATIVVEVRSISSRSVRRRGMRPLVEATVADDSGVLKVAFFNQPWLVEPLPGRDAARAAREVRRLATVHRAVARAHRRGRRAAPARSRTIRPRRGCRRPRSWRSCASTPPRSTTCSSRCRRRCAPSNALPGPPGRADRRALPARRRGAGDGPPRGWRSTSCCWRSSR